MLVCHHERHDNAKGECVRKMNGRNGYRTLGLGFLALVWCCLAHAELGRCWDARGYAPAVSYGGKMWVLGGYDGSDARNDVWSSADGAVWVEETEAAPWAARAGHGSVSHDGRLWVIGGSPRDVWYSTDGSSWTQAAASVPWTNERIEHASLVYGGKIWILGGYDGNYLNSVWSSPDGATWTEVTPAAPWAARFQHACVVHDGKMWLVGGGGSGGPLNDVWSSTDGNTWTEETNTASWAARGNHALMSYDGKMWIAGGGTGSGVQHDVWSSADGQNWSQATAAAAWQGRYTPSAVIHDGKMWLMGGMDGSDVPLDDVWWSTDGVNWTATRERVPPATPVIGTNAGMDFTIPNSTYTLEGYCDADVVDISINGSRQPQTLGDTTWSASVTLSPGENLFSFTALDLFENESAAATITVTYDPARTFPTTTRGPRNEPVNLGDYQQIRYVCPASGDDSYASDGTITEPWATIGYACTRIEDARANNRYAILVAQGADGGGFVLDDYCDLFGGYEADTWTRDIFAHVTEIANDGYDIAVGGTLHNHVDGFYIYQAAAYKSEPDGTTSAQGAAGVSELSNCIVWGFRQFWRYYFSRRGGGVSRCDLVRNCYIHDNYVVEDTQTGWGGGVGNCGTVRDCIISDNWAWSCGGVSDCTHVLNNLIMQNYSAHCGSGVGYSDIVANNVIYGNYHGFSLNYSSCGGISLCSRVINNTVVDNLGHMSDGSTPINGIFRGDFIHNNIVWNATDGIQVSTNGLATYNCIRDGLAGEGNIPDDPEFEADIVDTAPCAVYDATCRMTTFYPDNTVLEPSALVGQAAAAANGGTAVAANSADSISVWGDHTSTSSFVFRIKQFRLPQTSPCVDTGTSNGAPITDFEGHYRPNGYGVDMGADEAGRFPPGVPGIEITPEAPHTDDALVCTIVDESLVGDGLTAEYEYVWTQGAVVVTHGPKVDLTDTLEAYQTLKNETWTCSVRCWDGGEYSELATDSVTILNTPPGAPVLTLPAEESSRRNLRCELAKAPDPDGDVTYSVQWFFKQEGAGSFSAWIGAVTTTDTYTQIDTTATAAGDLWYCEVTYGDGEAPAQTATSGTCEILSHGTTPSFIFLGVSGATTITLGESVSLAGQIQPMPDSGAIVAFESTSPSGATDPNFPAAVATGTNLYSRTFYPTEASEGRGDWLVESSWPGDDTYMPAESDPVSFTVLKAQPTVLVELNTSSAPMGYGDLEATVTLSAPLPAELASLLSGRTVELHVRKPDQSIAGTVVGTTDASGAVVFTDSEFSAQGISFTEPGTWQFQANVDEDNNFYRATSVGYDEPETPRLTIKDRAGYAVLLLGKLDENGEGLAEHAKTLDYVYRVLRDRGFAHEDIYYFREGPAQPHPDIYVDDTTPSQADVANALEQWAVAKMNAAPAPLVVVFLDHGDVDAFYAYSGLYDESRTITPAEMDGYLDALQANLSPQAAEEPVVFICGSCHGGSFMPAVSDSTRLVITSCSEDEVSHRGVFDPTDGTDVRDGEPFVTELFRRLGAGDTLKASFEAASQKILEYTASTSNGGASTYPQHALLDDNGDGLGTSGTLSDAPGEDGGWARLLTLGYGVNAGASVGWLTATGTLTLGAGEAMPTLEARADENDPGGLHEAWVEVKTPLYAGADPADPTMPDYQQVVEMPQFSFEAGISDPANGYFRWATFGTTFDAPGTYQVFYYLRDGETGDASTHLLTTVYRESATNQPPDPVTLTYPADGATTFTSVIFAWEETTDPDGDAVTYRLEVSPDAGFATDVIVREGLLSTVVQLDETDGILDGATYYWRIVPVDPYGATPATNPVRTFSTDNNNPSVPSAFTGLVTCATTYAAVANATVTVGSTGLTGLTGTTGRFFIGNIATGTYTVAVSAAGYQTAYVVVTFLGGTAVSQSIRLTPEQNQLTVDPLTATLSPGGGTCQLTVGGSSLMNWQAQITSGAAWLGITSGASGTGPGAVNLSYAANTGSAPRSAVVRITAPGATGSPKDVILNQPVDLTPELSVSPAGRLLSASDTYTDFAVENLGYGTLYWSTQVILGNWITIDVGMAGENNGMIRLTLAKNTTPDDRIGTLWVSAPGANNGSQFLTITQTGDTTPPVLTIQGPDPKTIEQHAAYYDAGATALDDVDGDLTPCIACASTVDTSTPGTYHVDYSVRDTAQNTAADQRTVHVVATTPVEETVGSGGGSVSRDGILVVILPGALAGDTTVTIDRADPGAPVLPDDILALISGTTFAVGPEGQTALDGGDLATVTIWYPDADQDGYIDGTSYHENNVAIFRTDQSGGNPVALYGTVDPDANTITVTTECFSLFTVAAADPGLPLSPWVLAALVAAALPGGLLLTRRSRAPGQ